MSPLHAAALAEPLLQVVKAQRAAAAGQGLSSSSKAAEQVQYFDVVEYAPPQQPQAGPTRLGVVQEVRTIYVVWGSSSSTHHSHSSPCYKMTHSMTPL